LRFSGLGKKSEKCAHNIVSHDVMKRDDVAPLRTTQMPIPAAPINQDL